MVEDQAGCVTAVGQAKSRCTAHSGDRSAMPADPFERSAFGRQGTVDELDLDHHLRARGALAAEQNLMAGALHRASDDVDDACTVDVRHGSEHHPRRRALRAWVIPAGVPRDARQLRSRE